MNNASHEDWDAVFYQNLYEIEKGMHHLVHKLERIRVEQWVRKLLEPCTVLAWKKSRNRYSELLLYMVRNKSFKPPFDVRPPNGELPTLPSYMLKYIADLSGEPRRSKSPDNKKDSTLKKYIREAQLAEFSTTDFTRTKISNSDYEPSLNENFTPEPGDKGFTNGWKGEDSAEWKREVNSGEWKRETSGEGRRDRDGEEWKRDEGGEEEWGGMSGRGSALLMSSLHRQSPDRFQQDDYHDVLDHLEQKYVASLHSIHTLTGHGEAIQDSLQVAHSRINELENQLKETSAQLEEYKRKNNNMLKSHADQILKMSYTNQREMNKVKEHYQQEISQMLPKSVHESLERTINEQKKRTLMIEKQFLDRESELLEQSFSASKISSEQEEGIVLMLTTQLKEAKEQIQQLNKQIHELHLKNIAQTQQLQHLKDETELGNLALEGSQRLEKEIERLNEQLRQKDTEIADITHDHRMQLEHIHNEHAVKIENVKREYESRQETLSATEKRMVQSNEDNRRLLEVIRKQEKLIEELQAAAEQSNAQKLTNFQQTQSIHKTNKMQIAKLQEELQRLVDDNNALHKVMAEEQDIFSRELAKMQEEHDKQIKAMVSKTVRDGLEQTVLGLQQRLLLLESHIEDTNKMHQQELEHAKQLHELELSNSINKLSKDFSKQYEDKNRKKRLSSAHEEQKLAHLERVSHEQKHRINVLEQTISDMQGINRLKAHKMK
eukprot:Phypoly_transcript_04323.p1 GENE.Phypoly_transcript_04323~~Phypoly_transcript_04323.p1  ORF type:complete len:720 (+),score=131.29 Phypoly_transcript_04323:14-2173(+)